MSETSVAQRRPRKVVSEEYRDAIRRATERAKRTVKPGDRVSRIRCGGAKSTFTFTHWEGEWLCGVSVSDCHAAHIYKVNGASVTFFDGTPSRL